MKPRTPRIEDALLDRILQATGATTLRREGHIQSLWSDFGEVVRYRLTGGSTPSVVVKHVCPPPGSGHAHRRKLRSYEVEQTWYRDWARNCGDSCRVPRSLFLDHSAGQWLFVLEDLDDAGFPERTRRPDDQQIALCIRWLASFHATFLGERPQGLWNTGTYWHLATRPDELEKMSHGPLRHAAPLIDRRLRAARFQTLVHGDAKPANFCFSTDSQSVAAVDFQYVGGGCGMKDLAYLCTGQDRDSTARHLDLYFDALRTHLTGRDLDPDAVESEWRDLYPWAWADFQRFLAGWSPGWRADSNGQQLTQSVLSQLADTAPQE